MGSMDIPTTNLMTSWSQPKPSKPVHLLSSKVQKNLKMQKKDETKKLQNPSSILYKIQNKLVYIFNFSQIILKKSQGLILWNLKNLNNKKKNKKNKLKVKFKKGFLIL